MESVSVFPYVDISSDFG